MNFWDWRLLIISDAKNTAQHGFCVYQSNYIFWKVIDPRFQTVKENENHRSSSLSLLILRILLTFPGFDAVVIRIKPLGSFVRNLNEIIPCLPVSQGGNIYWNTATFNNNNNDIILVPIWNRWLTILPNASLLL